MKSLWSSGLGAVVLLILAVFTIIELWLGAGSRSRSVVLALRDDEVRRLTARAGYPLQDFWDRARAIGASAIVLSPQSAETLWQQGELLHFKGSQALAWPWANSAAIAKGNTLWTHNRSLLERIKASAVSQKLAVETAAVGGLYALRLPEGVEVRDLSAGFDPDAYKWAQSSGLIMALEADESISAASLSAPAGRTIYLSDLSMADYGSILQMARDRGAQAAWPDSSRMLGPIQADIADARGVLDENFTSENVPGRLWRAIWGRGARLLIVPMPAENGVEADLAQLRSIAGQLRDADFDFNLRGAVSKLAVWTAASRFRCWLAFLFAAFAPMLAVRQGLAALRCVSCKTRWPQAYPVPELAMGAIKTAIVASVAGLFCYALLKIPGWELGLFRVYWDGWAIFIPLILSAFALYSDDASEWKSLLDRQVTYKEALQGAACVGIIWLIIRPPSFPAYWLPERLWWLPLRWREALIGVPCLLMAFHIHLRRVESRQPRSASSKGAVKPDETAGLDPRHWLIFGLLAPIGTVRAFGCGLMPPEMLLSQTLQVFLIGSALGGLLIAYAV